MVFFPHVCPQWLSPGNSMQDLNEPYYYEISSAMGSQSHPKRKLSLIEDLGLDDGVACFL